MNIVKFLLRLGFFILFGIGIGYLLVENDIYLGFIEIFLILFGIIFAFHYGYSFYINYFTQNMKLVEKYILKYKKHPYFAFLSDFLNGNFDHAEDNLNRLKLVGRNKQVYAVGMANLHIRRKSVEEAKKETEKIKYYDIRNYNFSLIALLEEDWETFNNMKNKVTKERFRYALEAEYAFKKGNLEEAQRLGELAISASSGIQKYMLLKLLERQQSNPNREFFFKGCFLKDCCFLHKNIICMF
jgi:hypothetical protein